jgi:hypothetical protein
MESRVARIGAPAGDDFQAPAAGLQAHFAVAAEPGERLAHLEPYGPEADHADA